ncbi:methyltetrahydrofolate cobalamin methyltransferase [Sporomusa sp.]|uniref:methyltetrahydrofolate cobalamin methyltransferase n=1 Tax=Sporomusa sp. TaxID=2078658 RepID=UPI002C1CDC4E|nr:methyltetrahydrofolate cobalamin methyltransferase [Sporomusa sp.]HWR42097.1 methyltetrahydrofolate cobalamin methyltransferase [Sporomusa sp.]
MIIIGEKINGTIKSVANAIREKDKAFIQNLAVKQTEAGAHYIDVCAGTEVDIEIETLKWLIECVQEAVDTPICIDSPNPEAIKAVIPLVKKPGMINSVSEEGNKPDQVYPLVRDYGFNVICLTVDDRGIPTTVEPRLEVTRSLVKKASDYGIPQNKLYIDPLVSAVSTDNTSVLCFLQTMRQIKQEFPEVKITSGLSNVSFGMPLRKLVNRYFFCLALYEGMDSAIMDPLDKDLQSALLATQVLLGQDRLCRKFSNAYRKGLIG